jgi:hypothetical protein
MASPSPSWWLRRARRLNVRRRETIVNRTRILVALLVLVVLVQLFPDRATLIKLIWVSAAALYTLLWATLRYAALRKRKSAEAALAAADELEYRQYRDELDIIRTRFDPQRDLEDPTSLSPEYRDALTALHDKHHAMLERKFGPR